MAIQKFDPQTAKFAPDFNPKILHVIFEKDDRNVVVLMESEFKGRKSVGLMMIWRYEGDLFWNPSKPINVPLDKKAEFVAGLRAIPQGA